MSLQTIGHIFMVTQRENDRHRTFVDLSSLDCTASCHFPQAQESPSESRIHSELPLESAQKPRSNINKLERAAVSPALQSKQRLFQNICLYVNNLSLSFRIPFRIQSLSPCSHRSLFYLLDQQNMVFALCQMSPSSSPLSKLSPWQPLPQPRSCHVRLTVMITVQNMKSDRRNVTSPLLSLSFLPV